MPLLPSLGRTVGTGVKAARLLVRGSVRGSAWATRRVGSARARGAAGEIGMIRLFDLHAVSCAGDALIAIGLAGTIFSVPLGEARSKVALYLLITMVPFALLAPVVGPLLDHFRHGRRYALATTFLGRAFLAYVMADHLTGWALYPAAFGVLALSRAYGVARSAAVPRLLPDGIGLSQAGARASVYGTFAGALVAPIGLLAFKFGPQWPLRVAAVIFVVGMVVALRLPPRADSDPPEALPKAWRAVLRIRGTEMPLSGRLVVATLIGSSSLRLLYGFLLLFLTFAIMGNQLDTTLFGLEVGRGTAAGLVGGALALGTFVSTAAGTSLRIRRPLALQSSGLVVVAGVTVLTTIFYNLAMLTLVALLTAVFSGIAKLAVDASIQERVPEQQRATAFAHSETALMLAWVAGGGLGLIPFPGRLGIGFAAALAVLAALRAAWAATRLHNERLSGRPDAVPAPGPSDTAASSTTATTNQDQDQAAGYGESDRPEAPDPSRGNRPGRRTPGYDRDRAGSGTIPGGIREAAPAGSNPPPSQRSPAESGATSPRAAADRGNPAGRSAPDREHAGPDPGAARDGDTQRMDSASAVKGRRWWRGRRKNPTAPAEPAADGSATGRRMSGDTRTATAHDDGRHPGTHGDDRPAGSRQPGVRAGDRSAGGPRAGTPGGGPSAGVRQTGTRGGDRSVDSPQTGTRGGDRAPGRAYTAGRTADDDWFADDDPTTRLAGESRGNAGAGGGFGAAPAPPGYHVYRPSSADSGTRDGEPTNGEDS